MKSLKHLIAGITAAIALLICTQSYGVPILVHMQHIDADGRAIENPYGSPCGASLNHLHNQNLIERIYYAPGYNPIFTAAGPGQIFSRERVLDLAPGAYSIKGGSIVGGPPPFDAPFTVAADGSVSPNVFRGTITGQGYGPGCIPNTPDVLTRFVLTLTGNAGGGPAGATGATGATGAASTVAGPTGATGGQGIQGKLGPAGADAPCTPCDDVANAAVDLACKIIGLNPPTSVQELQVCAQTIVDTMLISANICEPSCDVGAAIAAAIDAKLNP